MSTSITQVEEDRLWQVVEHEVKRLHGGQSALTNMKTKNKKKQVYSNITCSVLQCCYHSGYACNFCLRLISNM
jgi:hypothetical protein